MVKTDTKKTETVTKKVPIYTIPELASYKTEAWSIKYPVLKTYPEKVDIPHYAGKIREMFTELQESCGYSELDAMLVLKDILAHEYLDKKKQVKKH